MAAVVAFVIARIVPARRPRRWLWELLAALITTLILGVAATALDFGGWNEPDWRAGLFALAGALAVLGALRLVSRPSSGASPP